MTIRLQGTGEAAVARGNVHRPCHENVIASFAKSITGLKTTNQVVARTGETGYETVSPVWRVCAALIACFTAAPMIRRATTPSRVRVGAAGRVETMIMTVIEVKGGHLAGGVPTAVSGRCWQCSPSSYLVSGATGLYPVVTVPASPVASADPGTGQLTAIFDNRLWYLEHAGLIAFMCTMDHSVHTALTLLNASH